jgi:glucoamylase
LRHASQRSSATAQFLEEYADFLESHIEAWTVTTEGTLLSDVKRHLIRILLADVDDPCSRNRPS